MSERNHDIMRILLKEQERSDHLLREGWLTKGASERPEGAEAARLRQPQCVGLNRLTAALQAAGAGGAEGTLFRTKKRIGGGPYK